MPDVGIPFLLKAGLKWDEWDNCNNNIRANWPKTGLQSHEKIVYHKLAFKNESTARLVTVSFKLKIVFPVGHGMASATALCILFIWW